MNKENQGTFDLICAATQMPDMVQYPQSGCNTALEGYTSEIHTVASGYDTDSCFHLRRVDSFGYHAGQSNPSVSARSKKGKAVRHPADTSYKKPVML